MKSLVKADKPPTVAVARMNLTLVKPLKLAAKADKLLAVTALTWPASALPVDVPVAWLTSVL